MVQDALNKVISNDFCKRIDKEEILSTIPRLLELVVLSETLSLVSEALDEDAWVIITVVNAVVFAAWYLCTHDKASPAMCRWMYRHFICKDRNILQKKNMQSILLSSYSHIDESHFASNMAALAVSGPKVSRYMRSRRFFYFYHASIYAAKLISWFVLEQRPAPLPEGSDVLSKLRRNWATLIGPDRDSLGASDALSAVIMFHALRWPTDTVYERTLDEPLTIPLTSRHQWVIRSIKEVPAFLLGVGSLASDVLSFFDIRRVTIFGETIKLPKSEKNVGHDAHIGGSLFGVMWFLLSERTWVWHPQTKKFFAHCKRFIFRPSRPGHGRRPRKRG